jgi:hypothetical protein
VESPVEAAGVVLPVDDEEEVDEVEVDELIELEDVDVGDVEETDELVESPTTAANTTTSLVPQQSVVVPQHQSVEVGVPSQGVIRIFPDESRACWKR